MNNIGYSEMRTNEQGDIKAMRRQDVFLYLL